MSSKVNSSSRRLKTTTTITALTNSKISVEFNAKFHFVCWQYGNDLLLSGIPICLTESARMLLDRERSMGEWCRSCDEKGSLSNEIPTFPHLAVFYFLDDNSTQSKERVIYTAWCPFWSCLWNTKSDIPDT